MTEIQFLVQEHHTDIQPRSMLLSMTHVHRYMYTDVCMRMCVHRYMYIDVCMNMCV